MPLENEILLKIEEFKEIGHEYRYREQLMVQEFGWSMLITGVVVGIITKNSESLFSLIIQIFGLMFLLLLTLHLRNINQDRQAALSLKESLRTALGFQPIHQNVSGRKHTLIRMSAPRAMVWFAMSVSIGWTLWTIISAILMVYPKKP